MSVQQRRARVRAVSAVLVVLFFFVILFAVYVQSPLAKVQAVRVRGASDLTRSELLADAGIHVGQSLLELAIAAAKRRLLRDFPVLSSVRIESDGWTRVVTIRVTQRPLAGLLAASGSLYQVLQDGLVLQKDPTGVAADVPIISTGFTIDVSLGQVLDNSALIALCEQLPGIPRGDLADIASLHVVDQAGTYGVEAFTDDGFLVSMPVRNLLRSLKLFLAIHSKLVAHDIAPGVITILSDGRGTYQPFTANKGAV
ncbi:MAG: FtsQ-type POTRA domain-containing protein [Firmicutes bacterium]|nr:FtsQ-type POTRA domain-containing protein [Bacillota bacterium]